MIAPTILPGRAYAAVSQRSRLPFSWRARDLSLDALSGQEATFARASVGGLVVGQGRRSWIDSELRRSVGPAADDLPRWEWVQNAAGLWEPALRLEGARQNWWSHSNNLGNGAWSKTRCSIVSSAVSAYDGAGTVDKIVEDTSTNDHYVSRSLGTLTDDTTTTYFGFFKAAERTVVALRFVTKDIAVAPRTYFDLASGTIGTQETDSAEIVDVGGGWYLCSVSNDIGSGVTPERAEITLASADGVVGYTGDGTSGILAWGLQVEIDKPFRSSFIPTEGSSVTRAVESVSWPLAVKPRALTIYCRFIERGTAGLGVGTRLWQFSNAIPQIYVDTTGIFYRGIVGMTAGTGVSTLATAPSLSDEVEVRTTLTEAGVVQVHQTINDGAEVSAAAAAGVALDGAFDSEILTLNGPTVGFGSFFELKVALGVQTRDFMREVL